MRKLETVPGPVHVGVGVNAGHVDVPDPVFPVPQALIAATLQVYVFPGSEANVAFVWGAATSLSCITVPDPVSTTL